MMKSLRVLPLIACVASATASFSSTVEIAVDCRQPTVPLSPHLYGLFFEDINFAADGGLYAELVQNRSFEYYPVQGWNRLKGAYHPLYGWEKVERGGGACEISVEDTAPLNENNTHYLQVKAGTDGGTAGVRNAGFNGPLVGIHPDMQPLQHRRTTHAR